MKTKDSRRVVSVVVCLSVAILLGCEKHGRSVSAPNPASEAQPLFKPEAASLAQQKMCDEQASKKFTENKHDTLDSYTSHYDPSVNVCYIRVDTVTGKPLAVTAVVYDAFGGRVYANYAWINSQNKKYWEVSPMTCEIHIPGKPDENCKTDAEFDALTEKYFGVAK
jgi:hypothetical protein